jgi:hypothetical protein
MPGLAADQTDEATHRIHRTHAAGRFAVAADSCRLVRMIEVLRRDRSRHERSFRCRTDWLPRLHWAAPDETSGEVDRLVDEAPLGAATYASSIGQRRTSGIRAEAPIERIGSDRNAPRVERRGRLQPHVDGFDLHAALRVAVRGELIVATASRSAWSRHGRDASAANVATAAEDPRSMRPRRAHWAELMRYAFGYELLSYPRCGCKMKSLACIPLTGGTYRQPEALSRNWAKACEVTQDAATNRGEQTRGRLELWNADT